MDVESLDFKAQMFGEEARKSGQRHVWTQEERKIFSNARKAGHRHGTFAFPTICSRTYFVCDDLYLSSIGLVPRSPEKRDLFNIVWERTSKLNFLSILFLPPLINYYHLKELEKCYKYPCDTNSTQKDIFRTISKSDFSHFESRIWCL